MEHVDLIVYKSGIDHAWLTIVILFKNVELTKIDHGCLTMVNHGSTMVKHCQTMVTDHGSTMVDHDSAMFIPKGY